MAGEFMEGVCVAPQSWECDFGGQGNVFSDANQTYNATPIHPRLQQMTVYTQALTVMNCIHLSL